MSQSSWRGARRRPERAASAIPFFAGDLGKRPHLHRNPEGFADLLSLDDVDHLISSAGIRLPAFRLVRQGKVILRAVTRRPRGPDLRLHRGGRLPAAVFAHFDQGATIVLQGMHRYWSPVGMLRSQPRSSARPSGTGQCLCHPAWIAGLRRPQGRPRRLVLQSHGTKSWCTSSTTFRRPGSPLVEAELEPGDSLYIPKNFPTRPPPRPRHQHLPWASSPSGRNS